MCTIGKTGTFQSTDKVKKITAKKSHTAPSCIEAHDGSIHIEKDKILKR